MSRKLGKLHTTIFIALLIAFSISTIMVTRSERITTQEYVFCHTVLTKEHPEKGYFKEWLLGANNLAYKEQSYLYEVTEQKEIFASCKYNATLAIEEKTNRKSQKYLVFTDTKKYLRELQENIYRINDLTERHLQYQLFLLEDQIVEEARSLQKLNDKTDLAQYGEAMEIKNRMENHMLQGQQLLTQIRQRMDTEIQFMKERNRNMRRIRNVIMVLFFAEIFVVIFQKKIKKKIQAHRKNISAQKM